MQLVNGTLFLDAKNLFHMSIIPLLFVFVRAIFPLTTIYALLKSHESHLSFVVLNLIFFAWFISIISTT